MCEKAQKVAFGFTLEPVKFFLVSYLFIFLGSTIALTSFLCLLTLVHLIGSYNEDEPCSQQ